MKLSKLLIIAIAALFFSACTTEEDGSFTRHELVFQVCMGNNETRAITDNSWSEGDFIFVKVGEDVKQYKITFDENSIPIAEGVDADNTFFWEDLAVSSVTVTAWSFGKKYVDAAGNGQIIVGMPEKLMVATFNAKLYGQSGNSKTYRIYGYGSRERLDGSIYVSGDHHLMTVWVSGGKVTSFKKWE